MYIYMLLMYIYIYIHTYIHTTYMYVYIYTTYMYIYIYMCTSLCMSLDSLRGSSVKIGTVQRRLAWPLRKDDTHKSCMSLMLCCMFFVCRIVSYS